MSSKIVTNSNSEVVWCKVHTVNPKSVVIWSFYRPPNTGIEHINELRSSIQQLGTNPDTRNFVIAGPRLQPVKYGLEKSYRWKRTTSTRLARDTVHHKWLWPIRIGNILDLYMTNKNPSLVKQLSEQSRHIRPSRRVSRLCHSIPLQHTPEEKSLHLQQGQLGFHQIKRITTSVCLYTIHKHSMEKSQRRHKVDHG